MTQVPLLSGIKASESAEYRQTYPINLEPTNLENGISKGQLRAGAGTLPFATGPGPDRGAIEFKGSLYRIMGTSVVKIDASGVVTVLGDVGGSGFAPLDQGFDRFSIASDGKLFYCDGAAVTQVTDPDLGLVIDQIWIAGYTMTTDGKYVVVTELNDPYSVKPLKYGSAESDPDNVTGLIKVRTEVNVLGRYSIEVLQNVGGNGFPFASVPGAIIPVGCVSPSAKCLYGDNYAFVGSARDEALGVYFAGNGTANRISTKAIDDELAAVADPTQIVLENRSARGERRLLVHLPSKTLVFCLNVGRSAQTPVWYVAQSRRGDPYRLRNATIAYGKTYVGDIESGAVGELSYDVSTHFSAPNEWQFDLWPIYNGAKGAILHNLELVGLPGRGPVEGKAFISFTLDGETWSMERIVSMGVKGNRSARIVTRPHIRFRTTLGIRIRGYDAAMPGFAACECEFEGLGV